MTAASRDAAVIVISLNTRYFLSCFLYAIIIEEMSTVETVRDISIIVLAVQTIVVQVILVLLLLEIRSLSKMLRENIYPILQSADETVRTVRGTSTFVSDTVVSPVVRASAFAAGVTEAIRILSRRGQ